jgi:hypothetical protein
MSRRARLVLGLIAILLLLAGVVILWYSLSPIPALSIQATVDPTFMALPVGTP